MVHLILCLFEDSVHYLEKTMDRVFKNSIDLSSWHFRPSISCFLSKSTRSKKFSIKPIESIELLFQTDHLPKHILEDIIFVFLKWDENIYGDLEIDMKEGKEFGCRNIKIYMNTFYFSQACKMLV